MLHNPAFPHSRSRFGLLLLVVFALAFPLAACSSSAKSASSSADITIKDRKFTTAPVATGASVTVQNNDDVTHTVTADDGGFDVSIDGGKSATFTAPDKAGSYKFHCNIHSTMKGTLTVE